MLHHVLSSVDSMHINNQYRHPLALVLHMHVLSSVDLRDRR